MEQIFEKRVQRGCGNIKCFKRHQPTQKVTWKLCSGCRRVSYCNSGCQRADWKSHKPHCLAVQEAYKSAKFQDPIVQQAIACFDASKDAMAIEHAIAARSALGIRTSEDISRSHYLEFNFQWRPPTSPLNLRDLNQTKRCLQFIGARTCKDDTIKEDKDMEEMKEVYDQIPGDNLRPYVNSFRIWHNGKELMPEQMGRAVANSSMWTLFAAGRNSKVNKNWESIFKEKWEEEVDTEERYRHVRRQIEDFITSEGLPEDSVQATYEFMMKKLTSLPGNMKDSTPPMARRLVEEALST